MSEAEVFGAYAGFYDALYADKDYEGECDFIEQVLEAQGLPARASVLDLGCGTGGHAIPLALRGFAVVGVDRAPAMVEQAWAKGTEVGVSARFVEGDVRTFELGETFDAVISMFAVVSYQLTDDDLAAMFATARRHLREGGVFVFDGWHGPAVIAQQPSVASKTVSLPDGGTIARTARPGHDESAHTVTVTYEVVHTSASGEVVRRTQESHAVRYLFADEISRLLAAAGFELIAIGPFGDLSRKPTEADWNFSVVARAV
ncbi:MAG: methyltransferase domain-containing protein [Coriobacteriia bacterium]|nr:methyltransferase domain-containing protein [Coriobacteriia bacterium]